MDFREEHDKWEEFCDIYHITDIQYFSSPLNCVTYEIQAILDVMLCYCGM